MPKQPETRFKEKIFPLLRALPCSWWVKIQMRAILFIPDILGCLGGRFVALELKSSEAASRKQDPRTKMQRIILQRIRDAGGFAEFVYPENWDEIHARLSTLAGRPIRL